MTLLDQICQLLSAYIKRRLSLYLGILILFVMGIAFGALAVQTLSESQKWDLSSYIISMYRSMSPNLSLSRQTLIRYGMLDNIVKSCGLLWLLGLTIIGAPLILIIIFLRGFVVGFSVGFVIDELFFKGIVLAIVSIVPHNIIAVPAIILAGGASFSFALTSFRTLLGVSTENIYNQFIACTFIMLLSGGLLTIGIFVEVYLTPIFINLTKGLLA